MIDHDVIVVGGGHNGLICSAYLARAGMDVAVLEARDQVGGCAATVDALGARVNICNCDHVLVRATPVIEELELADHGLSYLDLEPHVLNLTWGRRDPWFAFHDLDRTLDSLAVNHPSQVDGYRDWIADAAPLVDLIIGMTNQVPKARAGIRAALGSGRTAGVARLMKWNQMSAEKVLRQYFTDDAVMAPILATAPTVWGVAPDTPGTGLAAVNFAMRHRIQPGRPVGGSGAFPDAVRGALEKAGGGVECGAVVDRIVVEGGRVAGVRLESGDVRRAPTVVAAVDPWRVFVEWLDGSVMEHERWVSRSGDEGYESKIDGVLTDRPAVRALDPAAHGVEDPLVPTITIAPDLAGLASNHRRLGRGQVGDRPVIYVNVPSVPDPSLRTAGDGHVLSLETLFTPYRLVGGWDGSGEPERWLDLVGKVMEPGFRESVRDWRHVGPREYESDFRMRRGYATSFAGGPLGVLAGRDPELTRYRTSVPGLYLTGAATYPGAGVWGASGRNTATVVLEAA